VGLADEIPEGSVASFDSNTLIYYIERHATFLPVVAPFFGLLSEGKARASISVLLLVEVLVGPMRSQLDSLVGRYRSFLRTSTGIEVRSVDEPIAERAALIRADYGLRTPDAVVAATALEAGCSHLVTNDPAFRRIDELNVLVIGDYG
jgi:predicted nucleic acid-binding protein